MKKMMFLIVTVLFAVSFALPAPAEAFWPKETYRLLDELDEYGTHAVDENYNLTEEPSFGEDKMWLYEWYNTETGEFKPMGAYYDRAQEGWFNGGWGTSYVPYAEAPWEENGPACYCLISSNGKSFVPGNEAGPVVTYRVPADGQISFKAVIYPYGKDNTSENPDGGTSVYVYQNNTRIWPETEAQAKMTSDVYDTVAPKEISVKEIKVKEGDSIRLVVACSPGTTREGKGTTMMDLPTVTWHSAKYTPPENACKHGVLNPPSIRTENATVDGFTVCWSAVKNVDGYNVYVNGVKVNEEPIEGTEYTLTGLEAATIYEVAATSCYRECGHESAKSSAILARTRNKYDPVTDSSELSQTTDSTDLPTDVSTDTLLPPPSTQTGPVTEPNLSDGPSVLVITTAEPSSSDGSILPYVLIVLGALLVLGASAFFLLGRKKTDGQE